MVDTLTIIRFGLACSLTVMRSAQGRFRGEVYADSSSGQDHREREGLPLHRSKHATFVPSAHDCDYTLVAIVIVLSTLLLLTLSTFYVSLMCTPMVQYCSKNVIIAAAVAVAVAFTVDVDDVVAAVGVTVLDAWYGTVTPNDLGGIILRTVEQFDASPTN